MDKVKKVAEKIKRHMTLVIIILVMGTVLVLSNTGFASPEEDLQKFSGIVKEYDNETLRLVNEGGKEYTVTRNTEYNSGIEGIEVSEEIKVDSYIEGYYDANSRKNDISEILLNVEPIFDGTITEIDGLKSIVVPDEDEIFIKRQADTVYVALPDDIVFNVGDKVTVRYEAGIIEGDPLEILTLSVNGIPVD